jgi:hypothetical protein
VQSISNSAAKLQRNAINNSPYRDILRPAEAGGYEVLSRRGFSLPGTVSVSEQREVAALWWRSLSGPTPEALSASDLNDFRASERLVEIGIRRLS